MGRIALSVALLAAAVALGGTEPKNSGGKPDGATQEQVSASLKSIATALNDANKPSQHDKPCEDGSDNRASDLCAQWKAADAAQSSTNATWLFGYVGTLIGLLTLAAAGAAAWYARKAAIHTEESAKATERMAWDAPIGIAAAVEANNAMRDANAIAENAQRAWVRLRAEPQLVRRFGANGLYIRVNFVAENIGASPATHFMPRGKLLFISEAEMAGAFETKLTDQIKAWKKEYLMRPESIVLPSDAAELTNWASYKGEDIHWSEIGNIAPTKIANGLLLSAAFYRTIHSPNTTQLVWRAWYLSTRDDEGHVVSWLPMPKQPLGVKDLCAEVCQSTIHESYDAETA